MVRRITYREASFLSRLRPGQTSSPELRRSKQDSDRHGHQRHSDRDCRRRPVMSRTVISPSSLQHLRRSSRARTFATCAACHGLDGRGTKWTRWRVFFCSLKRVTNPADDIMVALCRASALISNIDRHGVAPCSRSSTTLQIVRSRCHGSCFQFRMRAGHFRSCRVVDLHQVADCDAR